MAIWRCVMKSRNECLKKCGKFEKWGIIGSSCFIIVILLYYVVSSWSYPTLEFYAPIDKTHPPLFNVTYKFSEDSDYVFTGLLGRTGNKMFQYAAAYGIARQRNMTPVLHKHAKLWKIFRSLSALKTSDIKRPLDTFRKLQEKQASAYDARVEHIDDSVILEYYLQSWRYFDHVRKEIHHEFIFKDFYYERAVKFLESNLMRFNSTLYQTSVLSKLRGIRKSTHGPHQQLPHVTLVGIHVRRGDILTEKLIEFGYTTPDKDYYDRAMDYFRTKYSNVIFVICSNGLDWVRENIQYKDVVISEEWWYGESDLALLTLCDHMIMSEGSFSWWAAYMVPGDVIYYKDWPKPGTELDRGTVKGDYFLPDWKPM